MFEAGAALADLPGFVDLALVELRAWLSHAASVLPSEYPARYPLFLSPDWKPAQQVLEL
jgi:hypothetical protein